jgi:hypothetical protein
MAANIMMMMMIIIIIIVIIIIAIPDDSNVNTKETEKLRKYEVLVVEVSRMRKVRTRSMPVMTEALGTIKKGSDQNLQLLPGHPSAMLLQRVTLTNEHRIQHLSSAGVNRFDLLLRYGLTGRQPPND